jgi:predicted glutamine amidotransferase
MCRLFGFRSNQPAKVHRSLVGEKNSLQMQSREHKDGWGIAYYDGGPAPLVAHGLGPAHEDPDFERVSSHFSSHAVVAHVRLASVGAVVLPNAHPFVYGRWSFAHNGTLRNFPQHRDEIEALIAPDLRGALKGDTDSERCFMIVLSFLREQTGTLEHGSADEVARAIARTMVACARITDVAGVEKPSSMNFMVSDGGLLVCSRRNRTLFISEGKKRHPNGAHAAPADGTTLTQLVIASEELSTEDHWHEVAEDEVVGVDAKMVFRRWKVSALGQPAR